jgi:hypothetical protein
LLRHLSCLFVSSFMVFLSAVALATGSAAVAARWNASDATSSSLGELVSISHAAATAPGCAAREAAKVSEATDAADTEKQARRGATG